jgi:uncharacterized protein
MSEQLLTPSKITAWLDCEHYLTLRHAVESGELAVQSSGFSAMSRMIADKGLAHEAACLADYEARGLRVLRVPERAPRERFADWAARVAHLLAADADVLYQMPLVHDGIRGIADFLIRTFGPATGIVGWEPVDAKLARAEAKPGHVLQLCFYADALQLATGIPPARMHLWLGSGTTQSLVTEEFRPYWRRLRGQLSELMQTEVAAAVTEPAPCSHCAFCEFNQVCDDRWRAQDALHYVAGIRTTDRARLAADGVDTLAGLAGLNAPVAEMRAERFERLNLQAQLQVLARTEPAEVPPYRMLPVTEERGFAALPEPDEGDVFLDYEGHPFWRPERGLFFLMGLITRDSDGSWGYEAIWAHDETAEARAVTGLVDLIVRRRAAFPNMHVYHYNHTERSALERMAAEHGVAQVAVAELVATGCFVDLYEVCVGALQAGVESYGLKHLELLTGYERGHDIDKGAGAVVEYEDWCTTHDPSALERIAAYNEDDVRAARALRDWLLDQRPDEASWRPPRLTAEEGYPELDAKVAGLHAFGPGTPEYLLGDVLGYWVREWRAYVGPKLATCDADPTVVLDQPDALSELTPIGTFNRLGAKGQVLPDPGMRFTFPPQEHEGMVGAKNVLYATASGMSFAGVSRLDAEVGELDLLWNEAARELGEFPVTVVLHDDVPPRPKPQAVDELAGRVLDPGLGTPNPAALALLRRDPPRFTPGHGPAGGRFADDVEEMCAWVPWLDESFVAVQGPPGTGKTYRGAHMIRALLKAGKRVGITAFSHNAIDNLLGEVVRVLQEHGEIDLLNAVRRSPRKGHLPGVSYPSANKAAAKSDVNLVAGTAWLFSGDDMAAAPVDVLVIDEAGQLSLADSLASTRSARNVVLLGDPLQLPQVAHANHPNGARASALEHVLGPETTMPTDRGVFIGETRRMHPDVCGFISDVIYESRLTSHPSCALQGTSFGTGLRWLRAEHEGRSTHSAEEAALVQAEITRLLSGKWTDPEGRTAPITPSDILVVAPFNDQVNLLRGLLDADSATAGVQVGTVDKFQGKEAAVVFFTMTTSTAADLSRGADFLFSRNRLNVAVSRARCLAYLVCTEELLNSRARDVETMRLIATLCAFAERAELVRE